MNEPVIELGEHVFVGIHNTGNTKCDKGRVYRNTPQKINGEYFPHNTYYDAAGSLLPNVMTEWYWCANCKASTRNGDRVALK